MAEKLAEVRRLLERYLVEIVEAYDLCPWARPARLGGELGIDVLWGTPSPEAWVAAGEAQLARPEVRVAMIIAPELAGPPAALRAIRDRVTARVTTAGVADFHPDSVLDLGTPARLVPFLRRSPDPMLQLVPLALLASVRAQPAAMSRTVQAQILGGVARPPRGDVADRIAAVNHARVVPALAEIEARLADIAADRRASYARVGIAVGTSR